jgi:hypothetical protein
LEKCLEKGCDAADYVGGAITDNDGYFVVDADRAERVQVALDYIKYCVDGEPSVKVITEKRVNPYKTTGRNDLSGTVDVQIHEPPDCSEPFVEIIDYKDGMSPVEAKDNPQLEQYALGVIDDNNLPQDCVIRMTIIQPKLRLKGLPAITSHDMTVKELREVVAPKLVLEAAATDRPHAPLVPGDVQCKYCRAKGGCTALVNKTMESVGMFFQPIKEVKVTETTVEVNTVQPDESFPFATVAQQSLGGPWDHPASDLRNCTGKIDTGHFPTPNERAALLAHQAANKDPTTMTNEQLVEILEAAPLMRQMLNAAEEEALNRAKAGQTVPGYKVVHGPGSRAWVHDPEEIAVKLVKMGIPKSAVYVTKLVSPPQAEKLVWEKKGVKTTLSEKQLKRMETEYVKKSPGRLTLVPESDPRPPVSMSVSAETVATFFSPIAPEIPSWLK